MPRRVQDLAVWLVTAAFLVWLTVACLLGQVEHTVSSIQISGGRAIGTLLLPTLVPVGHDVRLELFEDGRRLGPEVDDARTVRETRAGTYAVDRGRWPAWSPTRLYFSASDGSAPRSNERRYTIRYPRRQVPSALALLLASWIVLPLAALRFSRRGAGTPAGEAKSAGLAAWTVGGLGAVYSLFAAQAWLPPRNLGWLLALLAVALPSFLARVRRRQVSAPRWWPWLTGLLAWAALSSLTGGPQAAPAAAMRFVAVCCGGLVVYLAVRGTWRPAESSRPWPVVAILVFAAGLSLARDSAFDLARSLASLGLAATWPNQLVNPWTTKFLGHWLLVSFWCALAAVGWQERFRRREALWAGALGCLALASNGSRAGMAALLVSAVTGAAALRWPRAVRRLVIYGLVGGLLAAPLLAAVPGRIRVELAGVEDGAAGSALDLDGRSETWELAGRLILERPVQGWGFGASRHLPAESSPDGAAFPGGHPHNAALLIWLDLGLVGAVLAAGLVISAGRSIAAVESRRVHAALLALVSVTATYLSFNYPLWEPEVVSILWLGAALPSALLPPSEAARRRRGSAPGLRPAEHRPRRRSGRSRR